MDNPNKGYMHLVIARAYSYGAVDYEIVGQFPSEAEAEAFSFGWNSKAGDAYESYVSNVPKRGDDDASTGVHAEVDRWEDLVTVEELDF